MLTHAQVEQLVDDLAKPIMVLRFARGMMNSARGSQWVGAQKRADGARKEIVEVLERYGLRTD